MNVEEVINISKQRNIRVKNAITRVMENIHKKILYYARLKRDSCSYIVPPLVDNTPLYDREYVIKELFKQLDSEGYIVCAYPDGRIEICWNERLVQQKVKTDAFVIDHEQRKIKNLTKKSKKVDERFSFLANPEKTQPSIEKRLDDQIEKILGQRRKEINVLKKW